MIGFGSLADKVRVSEAIALMRSPWLASRPVIRDLSFAAYGLVKISKQRAFPFVEQSAVLPLRERIELRLRIAAGEGGRHMLMYLIVAPHELCGPQYGYFA